MGNSQTIYKGRTLTHNLQQPAQETNPLSTEAWPASSLVWVKFVGSQPADCKSDT